LIYKSVLSQFLVQTLHYHVIDLSTYPIMFCFRVQ